MCQGSLDRATQGNAGSAVDGDPVGDDLVGLRPVPLRPKGAIVGRIGVESERALDCQRRCAFVPAAGARNAPVPLPVPMVIAPAMIPLPPIVLAFTFTPPLPVPEPVLNRRAAVDRANARLYRSLAMDRQALIFLHIPKTAGTTLNRIIERQYSPFEIFTMDPYRIRATPERLKRLPEGRRRRLRIVRGHMFYGIHECLPQGGTYFTMLRDPVARALSTYYFILRRPLNPLHRKVKKERLTIEDCIRLFPQRHNLQCRMIAGVKDAGSTAGGGLLDMAKEHLTKSFSVVGICETFEESLMLMAATFDWQIPFYKNCKVSKTRPQINPSTVEMIREHNRLDVELYEFGKRLFEESLRKNEAAVRDGLAALRALPAPGSMQDFCNSTLGAGRFVLNKIASAI